MIPLLAKPWADETDDEGDPWADYTDETGDEGDQPLFSDLSPAQPSVSEGQGQRQFEGVTVKEDSTTVMVDLAMTRQTRQSLQNLLEEHRLHFDFVYVPIKFAISLKYGYGVVNFISPEARQDAQDRLDGTQFDPETRIFRAFKCQGKGNLIDKYRDSEMMRTPGTTGAARQARQARSRGVRRGARGRWGS